MSQGVTRICKVCGKEYPYCHTITNDTFRWQDVACCPEHAAEYFERVAIARGEKPASVSKPLSLTKKEAKPIVTEEPVIEEEADKPLSNKRRFSKSKDVE